MKPPRITKRHVPPSWNTWRLVEVGEIIRYTDRVLSYRFHGDPAKRRKRIITIQMGSRNPAVSAYNQPVNPPSSVKGFPYGWYIRRTS